MKTDAKMTSQTWEFGDYAVCYDYQTPGWSVKHIQIQELDGLSFGKPSVKAARAALRYFIGNFINS